MWICEKCKEENEDSFDSCWKCSGEDTELDNNEAKINETLSKKYKILITFQWLVGIIAVIQVIFAILIIRKYGIQNGIDSLVTIVSVILQLFLSYCIILIARFLFDLDYFKSNKKR